MKGGNILSVGFNKSTNHPRSPHPFKSVHAEFSAILGLSLKDLKDSDVYVFRENKKGQPVMARPCKVCMKMLQNVGVRRVFYTCDNTYYTLVF